MRVLGFIPNRFTYASLMKTLLEGKQFRRVLSLRMEMRELQIETNDVIKKLIAAAETGLAEETREQSQFS
jgi:pentatricopeptide repeat protein